MQIVSETATEATVLVTPAFKEMLADHRVFTREQDEACRWRDGEAIRFQKDCSIEPYVGIFAGHSLCSVGSFTYSHSFLPPSLKIGRYCSIAAGMETIGAQHPTKTLSSSPFFYDRRMSPSVRAAAELGFDPTKERIPNVYKPAPVVGNDVWIGNKATINPGVEIMDGSVVARQALVTRTLPAYSMIGGNPAKAFLPRFPAELSNRLLASRWWRLSIGQLADAPKADPEQFADWYEATGLHLPDYAPQPLRLWDEVQRLAG
jgi:acetyltransferase-like isoleucine patch superfamily enzyme